MVQKEPTVGDALLERELLGRRVPRGPVKRFRRIAGHARIVHEPVCRVGTDPCQL